MPTRSTHSRTHEIRNLLGRGGSLTPLQALGVYSMFRLADAIYKLRKRGDPLVTVMRTDPHGKEYAEYRWVRVGDVLDDGGVVTSVDPAGKCVAARYQGGSRPVVRTFEQFGLMAFEVSKES